MKREQVSIVTSVAVIVFAGAISGATWLLFEGYGNDRWMTRELDDLKAWRAAAEKAIHDCHQPARAD
jgi:hypothetical protein